MFAASGAQAVLLPCVLLWTTLYSFGLLNESREFAVRFEFARLFVIMPLGIAGVMQLGLISNDAIGAVVLAAAIYVLVSAVAVRAAARQDTEILA